MSQKFFSFIIFLCFINSFLNSFSTIKLADFTKTSFTLKEFVILEYTNNIHKDFNYEINFIFDEGNKPSTKAFYYDSFDKIQKGDTGFINYVYATSLKETRILKIPYNAPYYSDKKTYYIVLYDISKIYTDYVYLLNSLSYLPLKDSFFYHNSLSQELHFNFLVQESDIKYLHYQAREDIFIFVHYTSYFRITNEIGERFYDNNCIGCSGYVKIKPNIKYFIETALYAKGDKDRKEMLFKLEKYGRNILLEEDKEVERQILTRQNLTFFATTSDLNIDDNLYFKFEVARAEGLTRSLYIKIYESDNFAKLESSFPTQTADYDYKIWFDGIGDSVYYEFKKNLTAQKGVLFGLFFEREYDYSAMTPTNVKAIYSKTDLSKENYTFLIVFSIIVGIVIIVVFYCCCIKGKCDCKTDTPLYDYSRDDDSDDDYEYVPAIAKVKKRKY